MRFWNGSPRAALAAALALALALALATSASAQVLPREVRTRILEAVVEIAPYDDANGRFAGTGGSGTIISAEGHVLTNFHVVGDDVAGTHFTWHAIFVTDPANPDLETEHRYWARFVGGDARHDLAVLKIELLADESPLPAGTTFPAMAIGDSNTLIPGDPITVVGYPGIGGFTVTVTTGIVSGWLGEDLTSGGKGWIKTDARIAGGNSGGGAFDEQGLLVAVPTSRLQTNDGAFEEQNLLRPIALAMPLITAHVPNAERIGGVASARAPGVPGPGALSPPASTPPSATPRGTSSPDESITGSIGPGDETLPSGEYLQVHERLLTAGVGIEITLRSNAFDPYLAVIAPDGTIVLEVDDSAGEGLDVREAFEPTTTGSYGLVVTSAFPDERGAYELGITTLAAAPPRSPDAEAPAPGADPSAQRAVDPAALRRALDPSSGVVAVIPIGARIAGRLANRSDVAYHTYVVEVPAGTAELSVDLVADADLDLFVKFGSEIVDLSDDGDWYARDIELDHSARLRVASPRAGRWFIDVAYYPDVPGTATYSLDVR